MGLLIKEGKLEVTFTLDFKVYEWNSLSYSRSGPLKLFKQLGYGHLEIRRKQMTERQRTHTQRTEKLITESPLIPVLI